MRRSHHRFLQRRATLTQVRRASLAQAKEGLFKEHYRRASLRKTFFPRRVVEIRNFLYFFNVFYQVTQQRRATLTHARRASLAQVRRASLRNTTRRAPLRKTPQKKNFSQIFYGFLQFWAVWAVFIEIFFDQGVLYIFKNLLSQFFFFPVSGFCVTVFCGFAQFAHDFYSFFCMRVVI